MLCIPNSQSQSISSLLMAMPTLPQYLRSLYEMTLVCSFLKQGCTVYVRESRICRGQEICMEGSLMVEAKRIAAKLRECLPIVIGG